MKKSLLLTLGLLCSMNSYAELSGDKKDTLKLLAECYVVTHDYPDVNKWFYKNLQESMEGINLDTIQMYESPLKKGIERGRNASRGLERCLGLGITIAPTGLSFEEVMNHFKKN